MEGWEKIAAEKGDMMEAALEKLSKFLPRLNAEVQKQILVLLGKLVEKGNLVADKETAKKLLSLQALIDEAAQTSGYTAGVQTFVRDFDLVFSLNAQLHSALNQITLDRTKLTPFINQNVNNVVSALTQSGLTANLTQPIQQIVLRHAMAGAPLQTAMKAVEGLANTSGAPSALSRYVAQISRDAIYGFDGAINDAIFINYDMDGFIYVGSLMNESRPQCKKWVGKKYLTKEFVIAEIKRLSPNKDGFKPGTTIDNFAMNRGGYACRHSAVPAHFTEEMRKKAEEGGKQSD